ncbi:hypothetical protein ACEZ3G_03120 [Maribacter algicola]|uniref:Uncharacterized protein n=1 Tax=Meishania litoralis TaxID=3434685 RepID=A0ACC7LGC7_9FLAO
MNEHHVNCIKVLQKAQKENRYTKLIVQLLKDFQLANISVGFTLLITPQDLKRELHEKIYFLLMEKFNDYLNLMYLIDIPESTLKDTNQSDIVEFAEMVTFSILRRELQKVRFKEEFD